MGCKSDLRLEINLDYVLFFSCVYAVLHYNGTSLKLFYTLEPQHEGMQTNNCGVTFTYF